MFSPERVHHYQPTPETNEVRLTKVTPYVRLRDGDSPPLFLQNNEFWSEGGEHIPFEKVPGWAWGQVRLCNPVVLKDANFTVDVDAVLRRLSGEDEPTSGDRQSITTAPPVQMEEPRTTRKRRFSKSKE